LYEGHLLTAGPCTQEVKPKRREEFTSLVPLPDLSEEFEAEVLDDLRRRVALSARSLPSACCFTFLNAHQGFVRPLERLAGLEC
jgi:hypothetical protein